MICEREEGAYFPESYYSGRGRSTRVLGDFVRGKTARLPPCDDFPARVFFSFILKKYIKKQNWVPGLSFMLGGGFVHHVMLRPCGLSSLHGSDGKQRPPSPSFATRSAQQKSKKSNFEKNRAALAQLVRAWDC
jgi:hypothetical protein